MMRSLTASIDTKPSVPAGQGLDARGSRVGIIYQSVLDAVVEHRLPPGAKLTEEQLGAIFGASRTTVRSALQALAHDHIVTLARHRSAFVSSPTIEPRVISSLGASSSRPQSRGKRPTVSTAPSWLSCGHSSPPSRRLSIAVTDLRPSGYPAPSHRRRGDMRRGRPYRLPEDLDLAIVIGDRPLRTKSRLGLW
jgi:Bacterial regulatory proteins, gntR family